MHTPSLKKSTKLEIYKRLSEAKNYIQNNYKCNINLNQLSEIAMLSPYHSQRSFKSSFGLTPFAYIRKLKMTEALKLIKRDYSIADTALQLGFSDESSFSKSFKKLYNKTPCYYLKN